MPKAHFPAIKSIPFEGPKSTNPLAFKYYDPNEMIGGKSMKDHMRFSIAYWHSFRGIGADQFGPGTIVRPWEKGKDVISIAKNRMDAAFEFFTKLGVGFYAFHDRDIASEGASLAESNKSLATMVAHAKEHQKATGVRLLWGTANLFSNPRYMNGAATNPDAHVFAYAAAQVKKAMESTKELGGDGYVFWGGREGYETLLNTNLKREQDHLASFLHMAVDFAKDIGFKGQLMIEPKPKEPTKHQYDFDVASGIAFLRTYGLEKYLKFNLETNHATLAGHTFQHELEVAASAGMLGSIDANAGDMLLGWDTDQFNTDVKELTLASLTVLRAGGLGTGGINFDAKLRRASTDVEDLFYAHIGGMDAFALGLKMALKIRADGKMEKFVADRYSSYDSDFGVAIEKRKTGFKELEKLVLTKLGEPTQRSARQEYLENLLNSYLHQ